MEFPIWRIWMAKGIPLRELQEDWSLDEVMRANAILDMDDTIQMGFEGLKGEE